MPEVQGVPGPKGEGNERKRQVSPRVFRTEGLGEYGAIRRGIQSAAVIEKIESAGHHGPLLVDQVLLSPSQRRQRERDGHRNGAMPNAAFRGEQHENRAHALIYDLSTIYTNSSKFLNYWSMKKPA